jgi:phosphatidate cytidylyltransferase
LLVLYEFYTMSVLSGASPFTVAGLVSGALVFIVSYLVASGTLPLEMLGLMMLFQVLLLLVALYSKRADIIRNIGVTFLGLIYISLPLASMNYLAFPGVNNHLYTHRIVLGILVLVWISDTGAYVSGMTLGRHRLFPRISPKKSWEGVIGGAVFTLLAAWWLHRIMGILTRSDWLVMAAIVTVFGVYGDLTESLFKRSVDMKDSGSLIPGHGGILDRMDSVLFVMPVAFIYLLINHL